MNVKIKLRETAKKLFTPFKNALKSVGGFFSRTARSVWDVMCRNRRFARFAYVTFPQWRKKTAEFIKNNRFTKFIARKKAKIILPAAACAVCLAVMLCASVIYTVNSDYYPEGDPDVEYGMRIFTYSTFDKSDKKHGSLRLNWNDGVVNLTGGETVVQIKADVDPINMSDTQVEWSVSDEEYAEIDGDGKITAKAPGRVRIFANLINYGVTAEAKLLICQPVTGIALPVSTMTLYTGGSAQHISARVFPENASDKSVTWRSKDPKVASVDSDGIVKPVNTGMTQITATTADGGFEGSCFVTVVNPSVDVNGITLQNADDMRLTAGDNVNAIVTVSPSNARNKTLKWSSDDESVATVSGTGGIHAVSAGTANITVSSVNGVSTSFTVEVSAVPEERKPTEDIPTSTGGVTYTPYDLTFPQAVSIQMAQDPPLKIWVRGGTINASESDAAEYMDPNNYCEGVYKYQFMDLSAPCGVSEERLNEYLADKGILSGHAAAFIEAANTYGLNELYLVVHSCLETGNGTSALSQGQEVDGVTVFNMFGIGAYDNSSLSSGAARAYRENWTSIDAAIMGGAKYISESYVHSPTPQNTLYKMLWNPESPTEHQYATDVGWAVKQAASMGDIMAEFGVEAPSYDIPVYNGMIPPTITD